MKSLLMLVFLFPAIALCKEHVVIVEAMKFVPSSLTVKTGDTIRWVNKDFFPHSATALDKTFNSKVMKTQASWSYKAGKKGKFPYKCIYHPTMKGVLVVQ